MARPSLTVGKHCVLHIGADTADAHMIRAALADAKDVPFEIERVDTLAHALDRLSGAPVSAILLDVQLSDAGAGDGLPALRRAAPRVPVLVIGPEDDDAVALKVMQLGASDYLVATRLDRYWLPHALRLAIERQLADDEKIAEAERVESRLNSNADGLISVDLSGLITYLNRIAEAMLGWSSAQATGRPLEHVLRLLDSATRETAAGTADTPGAERDAPGEPPHWILIRPDGSESFVERSVLPIDDGQGRVTGSSIILRDISAARALSLRMSHLASHDPLTDLPNRLLLGDRLGRALALAHRHGRRLAVLFLDIDRFKHVNDSLGHLLGDELLLSVGREITMCVRSSDTVSRHGGDEFVIVLSELAHAEDAAIGAEKIIAAIARPHQVAGHEVRITVSIGISVYPDDGEDAQTLLKRADLALYHAKTQGRDRYQFFEPKLNARAAARQSIEEDLHAALEHRQFELLYQPRVNLRTSGVVGAEALIRWRHPQRGVVNPVEFVPVAEDCGLIAPIGRWVAHEACRQARAWQDAGLRAVPVAVNVSAVEFRSRSFVTDIADVLTETGLDPRLLEVELTESALMAQVDTTSLVLRGLKELGVRLAIDDFGTGWSSLGYMRRFPIDALKVDQSFIREVTANSHAAPIVSAVISMGKSLNLRVVAEGVETRAQLDFLLAEGCDEGQGYHFSRPLAASQFARVLESGSVRAGTAADELGAPTDPDADGDPR